MMYNFDLLDGFQTITPIFPTDVRYHNDLINRVLDNEQQFLAKEIDGQTVQSLIELGQADEETVDVFNQYQLLKQVVLENATLLKYDSYFKPRKLPNGTTRISFKETYQESMALQSLFFSFMVLKELLQAQELMPSFPYRADIFLKVGKETQSKLMIDFSHEHNSLVYTLNVTCSSEALYYHALGLGLGHGTYFNNMYFHSNLQKSLAYFQN